MIEFANEFGAIQATTNGGQLLSWQVKNNGKFQEVLYKGSEQKRTGIPILFPFADPLENNIFIPTGKEIPQHGFARNSIWEEVTCNNGIKMRLNSKNLKREWEEAFNYDYTLEIEIIFLHNQLIYKLSLTNLGKDSIPIAPGIHPYFPVEHNQKKTIKTNLRDFDFGSTDWDDFNTAKFTDFTSEVMHFEFPEYKLKISETSPQKTIDNLVIWSQMEPQKDVDFICLEPFTRATNGINTDPILVEDTWSMQVCFEVDLQK